MKNHQAFTLIELLIVIVIIGILMTLGIASWATAGQRSRDNARKADLARIKNALQQYYSDNRTYPTFNNQSGRIYSADWQLTNNTVTGCQTTQRLTPLYMTTIPDDPKQGTDLSGLPCNSQTLSQNQQNRYLYLTGNSDVTSGPTNPATAFALMASLERPQANDIVNPQLNPLIKAPVSFGGWYSAIDNSAKPISLDLSKFYLIANLGI